MIALRVAVLLALAAGTVPAAAASFGIEASTDLRRRGLSWSDGRAGVEAWGSLPINGGLSVEGGTATLRGSARHGGADLLAEAALRYAVQTGAWQLWADLQGIGFVGALGQNYGQVRAGAAFGIGHAQLSTQLAWAPPQHAIGGSNLYVSGRANLGVPGTPLTLGLALGRSMGSDDGSGRSARLRPGGDYTDVRLDADYVLGAVTVGASLTATTIAQDRPDTAHSGTRLLLRAGVTF